MIDSHATPSRRSFLHAAGFAALGVSAAPAVLRAHEGHDHGQTETIGHGDFQYRPNPDWGTLDPAEHPVRDCHGMVQDSRGRVVLLNNHTDNNTIIYDKAGKLLNAWGNEYPGAHGLSIVRENGEDFLWITDHDRHEVYKTTTDGEVLMTLGYPEEADEYDNAGQFKPTHVTVAPNGDLYILDGYGLNYVIQCDSEGNIIRLFGGRGDQPHLFATPHGGTVDTRDENHPILIITSREHNALKRFELDGTYIDTIPMPGARPCHVVQSNGHMYVPNLNGFCSIFDENNRIVSNPGGNEPTYKDGELQPLQKATETFIHPHGLMVDDEENVYIAQWNSNQTYPIKLERVRG